MNKEEWILLAEQTMMGCLYGLAVAAIALDTSQMGKQALIILMTGAFKGGFHAMVKVLEPKMVSMGRPFDRKLHWTEKLTQIL